MREENRREEAEKYLTKKKRKYPEKDKDKGEKIEEKVVILKKNRKKER